MAGDKLHHFFENGRCFLYSTVIGRLDELLHGEASTRGQQHLEKWTFLQEVQEVGLIVLYDRQEFGSILTALPCQSSFEVHCANPLIKE